ncbi:MAG: LysM peptidoglycan-binding domain-containing protein, partial [Prolixibacteraceae bacterium]|nr:LysM peptidoglycan-binding domain-containing protein [Prolixibacteraceae bacterium]
RNEVKKGETLYYLSKKYKISESEILFYNPGARDLKTGSVIYIPRPAGYKEEDQSTDEIDFKDTEVVTDFSGASFAHTIVSGETLWGISRKYGVTEEELIALNPILESDFPAGVTIRVPLKKVTTERAMPVNEEAFINHTVQSGETLYGLSVRYKISIPDIKRFNPSLENRNLVSGETILIPRKPDEEIIAFMKEISDDSVRTEEPLFESDYYEIRLPDKIPDNCRKTDIAFSSGKVYNIALFLPLFIDANDNLNSEFILPEIYEDSLMQDLGFETDTLIESEQPRRKFHGFYGESENFLQFYEGVLLAVDSMQRAGMNIRLKVFDTQRSTSAVRRHIHSKGFLETDLIIGPVFPEIQADVSAFASKNRIPVISPLSSHSDHLNSNPYYYQVNPAKDFLILKTAELVAEEFFNSNFIVFNIGNRTDNSGEGVPALIRERLINSGYWGQPDGFSYNTYNFDSEGPFGFSRILSKDKENVIFIPSQDEGDISVALSNIDNLSKDYSITLIGFNWYQQYKSIELDRYHNLQLHYIAPYWVDFKNPETVRFYQKFKDNFYTEPGNFGMQGYDVTFYFLNALRLYGNDFNDCLPFLPAELIQGDYRFEKVSRFGGFMNQGASIIVYQKDYDVVRKRVIGHYNLVQNP